jgi:ABC-type Fe3+ transport system permease subunit
MPITCYLVYTHWTGWKYFKSDDPKAQRMGTIAIILLAISFIFIIWSTWAGIIWFQQYIQQQETSANSLGGYGNVLGG